MNSSLRAGSLLRAVGQLARAVEPSRALLRMTSRAFRAASRARARQAFLDDPAAIRGFSSRYWVERIRRRDVDLAADLGLPSLRLGLALELRLAA